MRQMRKLFAVLISTAAMALSAQAPPAGPQESPMKGAVLKGRAPVSNDVLRVKLPRPREARLGNGSHLMVLEDRRVPTISFQIVIPGAGGFFDPPDQPGLAEFVASMLREGTTTRTSQQISARLETMAASLGASTGMGSELAAISGSCLTENVDELLDLAADILLNPSFPAEELDRFKRRAQASFIQQRANPGFLASEAFARKIYGPHPAGRVSPTREALDRTSRDDLMRFHREQYHLDHAIVAVAGDISMSDARQKIDARLRPWTGAARRPPAVADPPAAAGAGISLVHRPGSVQTALIVGGQAIDRRHPDFDALTVMNRVVGGGPTGRLFLNLREDKGYTYGAYSSLQAPRYRGDWRASTQVRTEVTEPALGELLRELARIRDERVPANELEEAKRAMVASFALSLESPMRVLDNHITRWLFDLPADYWDRYPDRVMVITGDQVQAVARRYLDQSRLHIVAVGDASVTESALAQFGSVTKYDVDGNPIK